LAQWSVRAVTRFSITIVATDRGPGIVDVARVAEGAGLDGLWIPDHTHVPIADGGPSPLGADLPMRYRRNLETLTAVAMAAAVTTRIRVGTGVLLAALRDPIVTAKALATIDDQSGGRVAVGVGYGWNVQEIRDHGVDPKTRRTRTREHVLAMQRLWEDDEASFAGRFVSFAASWSWPKPAQRPLPLLLGGPSTPLVFDHVAEFGTGWIPVGGHGLAGDVAKLRDRVSAEGRDPEALEVIPFTSGSTNHGKVDALQKAGATEIAFDVSSDDPIGVLDSVERIGAFVAERRGR
jgi:probable F420-dependent oxidoreductase